MRRKLNILPKLSYLVILILLSSCSNKFVITQKPNGSDECKKISFNTGTYCTLQENGSVYSRDWYNGKSTVTSSVGVLKIEFDFFEGEDHENIYPQSPFYNFLAKPAGYRSLGPHSFQSRIGLDKRNLIFINYTQRSEDPLSNLFVLEAKVTGGKGIFKNASGDITTRVQINRISRSALTNHTISIYLNN